MLRSSEMKLAHGCECGMPLAQPCRLAVLSSAAGSINRNCVDQQAVVATNVAFGWAQNATGGIISTRESDRGISLLSANSGPSRYADNFAVTGRQSRAPSASN